MTGHVSMPSLPVKDAHHTTATHGPTEDLELSLKLDRLLEHYLSLLDEYSKLREAISKQFSEGFFTLARAQRTSGPGAGRRYGQDEFDQRMQAIRRVRFNQTSVLDSSEGHSGNIQVSTTQFDCYTYDPIEQSRFKKMDGTIPAASHPEATQTNDKSGGKLRDVSETCKKPDPGYRDPATWYGLLVPPLLRQTQGHFAETVDEHIPSLLTVRASMEVLEKEISNLRARLKAQ